MTSMTLDVLNAMDAPTFVAALGEIFEHAPWVAEAVTGQRPFATVGALHAAMVAAVAAAGAERQLAFIQGHPELGSKVGRVDLTAASRDEQGGLGLDRLADAEFERFFRLNTAYRARFGFPFIICVRRHTRDSILAQFERRLGHSAEEERTTALAEIGYITRLRLVGKVDGPGKPRTDGRLSTHVLDTASGRPAPGVKIVLTEIGASARSVIVEMRSNADGRTDQPLMGGGPLRIGTYEIAFHAGDYFRARGDALAEPAFLDVVPIRFAIAEAEGHYHVPLLVSPWSYATYRGS
ncbi:MAG: 2-oxo-4-hydroxy-4-carboxy-5-ureidoimidazoline decarboxylase [Hyphomicrobiaceae bacterium]